MTAPLFSLDPALVRAQFPALQMRVHGRPAVFFDGPAGTQVPERVIDAISRYLSHGASLGGGSFASSHYTDNVVAAARQAIMDLLNARHPDEIAFGQNMTSLTFSMSRALARTWQAGDEIILTRLDHDANVTPWVLAAEERGVTVRWLDIDPADATLRVDLLPSLLNEKTRLVAVGYASNALGTINPIQRIAQLAHGVGALVYVDAVHYAPHGLIDVQQLDCDFLVASVYKFFGPHIGVLYGKYELLDKLEAYKVRPASSKPAGKWETGVQNSEAMAGLRAAVDYLADLGGSEGTRRERLVRAMHRIKRYEMGLADYFLRGVADMAGIQVYGITDIENLAQRVPTFGFRLAKYTPEEIAVRLGDQGIFVWNGHNYAVEVMTRLGLIEQGSLVRVGLLHYNTTAEIERLLDMLRVLGKQRP
ncbi:MAG: cysteine desulfurase-like protein [Chloroflexi bacterium]|nr:cysteine desulfurase-like protein [Chloroflexota bacterium]MDA0242987.1 cysteine desulfurase-like protein [Chloroflexota bacterium]